MTTPKDLDPRSPPAATPRVLTQGPSTPSGLLAARKPVLRKLTKAAAAPAPPSPPVVLEGSDDSSPPLRPWDVHLARASTLRVEIPTATDALNASLHRAEQALTALNLGVTASVSLYPLEEARNDWNQHLRFGKDSTGWRLILESGPDGGDAEDWSESPLLNASKEVRLQAVARLPALLEKLVQTAEKHLASLRQRAAEADVFASTVLKRKG